MKNFILLATILSVLCNCNTKQQESINPIISTQNTLYNELQDIGIQHDMAAKQIKNSLENEMNFCNIDLKKEKIKKSINAIQKIDDLFSVWLEAIETKRLELLKKNNESQIIVIHSDKTSQRVSKLNLNLLKNASKIVDFELMKNFDSEFVFMRGEALRTLVESSNTPTGVKFQFADPEVMGNINDKTALDKISQIWINSIMSNDDPEFVNYFYKKMLLEENFEKTNFKNCSILTALISLNALELKLLSARHSIFSHIKSRISTGSYSTDSIEPVVNIINQPKKGGVIELEVYIGGRISENIVTSKAENEISSKIVNGKTNILLKSGNENTMLIKGNSIISDYSGEKHVYPWEKIIYLK